MIGDTPKPNNELVANIIDTEMTLDEKIEESEMKIFSESAPLKSGFIDLFLYFNRVFLQFYPISGDLKSDGMREQVVVDGDGRKRRKVIFEVCHIRFNDHVFGIS